MKKLTIEQAIDLRDKGIMTDADIRRLQDEGCLRLIESRTVKGRPDVVDAVQMVLVHAINQNSVELFKVGYRPQIIWKKTA